MSDNSHNPNDLLNQDGKFILVILLQFDFMSKCFTFFNRTDIDFFKAKNASESFLKPFGILDR